MTEKVRILIVEDNQSVACVLKAHLEHLGYQVCHTAITAEEAIAEVEKLRPDLVLMDIVLPGKMDGIQAAEIIAATHDIPIIYLTAYDEQVLFDRAKASMPYAYVLKPFSERELSLTIEIALYRYNTDKRLRASEEHLAEAQKIGHIGSWEWDIANNRLHWSDNIYRIFGMKPREMEVTYDTFLSTVAPEDVDKVSAAVDAALNRESDYEIEHNIVLRDGEIRCVRELGSVYFDGDKPLRMIGTVQDITDLKRYEQDIKRLAFTDTVTGLANRNLFLDHLELAIQQGQRHQRHFTLLSIDLDGFKQVNDTHGHQRGDELLRMIGERLSHEVRSSDTACRIGGDEFMMLLQDTHETDMGQRVATAILNALEEPFSLGGTQLSVGASIGIVSFPENGASSEILLKKVDKALYAAKAAGKNTFRIYRD